MSLDDRIRAAASRNDELLAILQETDPSVPALHHQRSHIASLEAEAASTQSCLDDLAKQHKKELKDHEKYRDSVLRRLAYRATGQTQKFADRAAKEEREYFDVLRDEHHATQRKRGLDDALAQARAARDGLESAVRRNEAAHAELDGLYDSIFNGPSEGFPEEDARERARADAQARYGAARARAEAQAQAAATLLKANEEAHAARVKMSEALDYSTWDMWGGGTMSDMMERNALSRAEVAVASARACVAQAQRLDPEIREPELPRIAQSSLLGDVIFDNIFSDMAFHDKIEKSAGEVDRYARALANCLASARAKHDALMRNVHAAEGDLRAARVALQEARMEAFARTVGVGGGRRMDVGGEKMAMHTRVDEKGM